MLLQTFLYIYCGAQIYTFVLGVCLRGEISGCAHHWFWLIMANWFSNWLHKSEICRRLLVILHLSQNLIFSAFSILAISGGYIVISHHGFNFHFYYFNEAEYLLYAIGHSDFLFVHVCDLLIKASCLLKNRFVVDVLYILSTNPLFFELPKYFATPWLTFNFLSNVFWWTEV